MGAICEQADKPLIAGNRVIEGSLTCLGEEGQGCLEHSDRSPEVGLKDKLHLPQVRVGSIACRSINGESDHMLQGLMRRVECGENSSALHGHTNL